MPASPPLAPFQKDLLAELDRLSQGRGLTYGERTRLATTLDVSFIDAQVERLEKSRRWQPVVIGALFIVSFVLLFFAGGATADPTTWLSARPHGITVFVCLFAGMTPFLKYRALSQKLGIYRALRAVAAPTPTA